MLQRYHDTPEGATFDLLPAIDLRAGRVVRLIQGDFGREISYGDDPVALASTFATAGATWLHIVDLSGARAGRPVQLEVLRAMAERLGGHTRCEFAGGLRSPESVDAALDSGATRVVVGTAALRNSSFAADLVGRLGADRIVAAVDVRDGRAVGDAWRPGAAGVPVDSAVERLADAGVLTFEVTAVDRDGMLGGPDLELLERIVGLDRGAVIASAGIRSIDDLLAVRDVGCAGAIVGRALYEGRFTVADAIAASRPRE